jgi:hypothetical protein
MRDGVCWPIDGFRVGKQRSFLSWTQLSKLDVLS